MPSVTREPLCSVKYCPTRLRSFKGDKAEWHEPWCGHGTVGHHHHVPKRSQGGKTIVFICPECHDKVDNTPDFDNDITPGENGRREYILWDTRVEGGWNNPIIRRPLGEAERAGAGVGAVNPDTRRDSMTGSAPASSASPLSSAGEGGDEAHLPPTLSPAEPSLPAMDPCAGSRYEPSPESPELDTKSAPDLCASPSLALPGTITPTSLTLPQTLSLEGWGQVGETLGKIHRASRFWIGDWLTFGEDTFGEKAAQAMESTGLEFETLANIASICRRVPASRRRESLTFGHHDAVAAQEPERQETLLAEAEKQSMSVRELREAVSPSEPKERHECPSCGADHVRRVT